MLIYFLQMAKCYFAISHSLDCNGEMLWNTYFTRCREYDELLSTSELQREWKASYRQALFSCENVDVQVMSCACPEAFKISTLVKVCVC